jgi:putative transcriptional regulator
MAEVFKKPQGRNRIHRLAIPILINAAKQKMRFNKLAERIGITTANLSILKTGKAKAIRFSTLEAICEVLECQPGDIMEFVSEK